MKQLCYVIQTNGKEAEDDGTITITFGDLFEVCHIYIYIYVCVSVRLLNIISFCFQIYTNISDKLVGVLLKARKQGYLTFKGEILLQNRDENIPIQLIRLPS